ncbi:MAG: ABC transporter permease [Acidobacteriota bacterium]|jgi:phospholipid/cholesterol/gamma-HCH transport system permease protein
MAELTVTGAGTAAPSLDVRRDGDALTAVFGGPWLLSQTLPGLDPLLDALGGAPAPTGLKFDTSAMTDWDTGLVIALLKVRGKAEAAGVAVDASGLPEGARKLIALSLAVKPRSGAARGPDRRGYLERLGERTLSVWEEGVAMVTFLGETVLSLGRFMTGRATYLKENLLLYVQQAGADALPIVALISLLIGMIFAFVGVVQLNMFGAGIYTADLVAVAMIREIAAIMTAIIAAGRTGAAYAAEIGTMKVNQEVDALTTLGIDPMDFLVTPRVIALILMMPLLAVFSSLMGIIGGMLVGLSMLDASLQQYVAQTISAVQLNYVFGGLFKALVYGSLVALAGCMQGMACGSSAMAVGVSTTRAVVMSIVLIVVSASVLTIVYINLGI